MTGTLYTARYARYQNVAWAPNDVKWAKLSPNYLGVVQPIVTTEKMNYKSAKALVQYYFTTNSVVGPFETYRSF